MKKLQGLLLFIISLILIAGCKKSQEDLNKSKTEIETSTTSDSISSKENYAAQSVDELMSKNIANFLTQNYVKDDLEFMSENDRKFQMYKMDLNEDGKEEYFVLLAGSYFCGSGGCTILLLDRYSEIITTFTVMQPPLFISSLKTKGWRNLMIESEGKLKELIFNGKSYPSNPSVLPDSALKPDSSFTTIFDDRNFPSKTYTY